MKRHPFDSNNRISAGDLEELPIKNWLPPAITSDGRLIPVEPREDPRRETKSVQSDEQQPPAAGAQADSSLSQEQLEDEKQRARHLGHAEGHAAGRAEGHAEGIEQGLAEGREQGREEGLREAREEINAELARLNRLATSLSHALNEQDYQLEQALLKLVEEIARQVVQRELELDRSTLLSVIREALQVLPPTRDNLRILVNPEDLPLLEQAIDEGGENWQAQARRDIAAGGCRIETEQSVVDYTTEHRFQRVIEQIMSRQLVDEEVDGESEEALEEAPEPLVKPRAETESQE